MPSLRALPLLALTLLTACPAEPTVSPAGTASAKPIDMAATATMTAPPPTATASAAPAPPKVPDLPAPTDVAEAPADAKKTASGLATRVLTKGTGKDHPGAEDMVKVHYTGWTKAGKMFDSSVTRGEPISFRLNQVIKGWTEGVQLMVAGEKRRLWIPGALAYGDKPTRPGAPAGMLVFDIELLSIK